MDQENPRRAEFLRLLVSSGWSQRRAARELALSASVITHYIQGKTVPSLTVLRLFAAITGDRLLLPGESEGGQTMHDGPRWLEEWESQLVRTMRRLSPDARRRVVTAVEQQIDAIVDSARRSPARQIKETFVVPTAAELGFEKLKEYGIDPGLPPESEPIGEQPAPLLSEKRGQRRPPSAKDATRPTKN